MLSLWERRDEDDDDECEDTAEDDVVDREDFEDFEDLDDDDGSTTGTDPGGGAANATSASAESSTLIAPRNCSSCARRSVRMSSATTIESKFDGRRALGATMYWKRLSSLYKS